MKKKMTERGLMSSRPLDLPLRCMSVNRNFTEISAGITGNHTALNQIGLADI